MLGNIIYISQQELWHYKNQYYFPVIPFLIVPVSPRHATYLSTHYTTFGLVEQYTERGAPDAPWDMLTLRHHGDSARFRGCQGNGDAETCGSDLRVPIGPQWDQPVQTRFTDRVRGRLSREQPVPRPILGDSLDSDYSTITSPF